MNRSLKRMLAGAFLLGSMATVGCSSDHLSKVSDPCWPDRYSNEARQLTVAAFEPQVMNGHILDLTLWNTPVQHFETGTAKISPAGLDKLDQLARRRPQPDSRIYIQTARDIPYNAEKPEEYAAKRTELDIARVAAVKKYLEISLTGRPATFDVQVHDPAYPGIDGAAPRVLIPAPQTRVTGAGAGGAGGAGGGRPNVMPVPQAPTYSGGGTVGAANNTPGSGAPAPQPGM